MSAAKQYKDLTQTDFDRLLKWLNADRELAGLLYERIRWRLVTILAARGCALAEELADETIDRVARRVADIEQAYVGDKSIYFLGVMNNVHHEYLRRPVTPGVSEPPAVAGRSVVRPSSGWLTVRLIEADQDVDQRERVHLCLDNCLSTLAPFSRQLIERYYAADKRAKIDLRKVLARELGIKPATLRLRALRIREKLQVCIGSCLNRVSEARP